MSVMNFVQCGLVTPIATNTTELVLNTPAAPYQLPPLDGGTLVIADSVARPSFYEIISYTHRIDNVIYGVVRAKEGTTARAWAGTTWVYQALTAADFSKGTSAAMVSMGADSTIDLAKGNGFTKTISGATTLSLSNVPASPLLTVWLLELTNGGSAAVTWWSGISWAEQAPPTLTAVGRDVIGFYTANGGATSIGFVVGLGV